MNYRLVVQVFVRTRGGSVFSGRQYDDNCIFKHGFSAVMAANGAAPYLAIGL